MSEINKKAEKVKLLVLDVDGVLTDGRIIYDSKGHDLKLFDVHDGLGVSILKKMGIKTVLLTAKGSKATKPRAKDMGIDKIYENIVPKTKVYEKILKDYDVSSEDVCFVGDDLLDIGVLKRVGFPIAVSNACMEVKNASAYVTEKRGGRGAVREVAELILKSKGLWKKVIEIYEK